MKLAWLNRIGDVLSQLPDVYTIMPTSNYQDGISHSASELTAKAWGRTNEQMRVVIESFDIKNPNIKQSAASHQFDTKPISSFEINNPYVKRTAVTSK